MKQFLNEGLNYHDMEGQIEPKITVDEYAAKIGKDKDIVTLSFKVNSELAADDLVGWFERGYHYVLDAAVSEGEIDNGKYLVFVEMDRRSIVPERIVEMLKDLETLTDIPLTQWAVEVDGETYDANEDVLKQVIITSPLEYKKTKEKEDELNEFRDLSNLDRKKLYEDDAYIKNIKAMAGM
jgi:hypothetical protein